VSIGKRISIKIFENIAGLPCNWLSRYYL